jgi:hypothetical protein
MPSAPKSRAYKVLSAAVTAGDGCRLLSLHTELGPIVFAVPESIAAGLFKPEAGPSPEAQRRAGKHACYHRTSPELRARIQAAVERHSQGGIRQAALARELGISPEQMWYYCRKAAKRPSESGRKPVTKPGGKLL